MSSGPRAPTTVQVLRRDGDPFAAEAFEEAPPPVVEEHVAVLNHLFYDSTVDLGGVVRVDRVLYVCTRAGWRQVPAGREP